jgi:hypothetical protein
MDGEQKREHFRIVFPLGQHAKILIKKTEYDVIDVSQRGIRFAIGKRGLLEEWDIGTIVKGSITFLHGGRVIVSGTVLRTIDEHSVVLYLDEPIELKTMYDEHRFVIQKYGAE